MAVPPDVATQAPAKPAKPTRELETVTIFFAGDSGDGMQLTGTQFTNESALAGNDVATLPDFPAEIRAPAGTLAGVSGFQLNFSSRDVHTPGDNPDVLVAMNAAALRVKLGDVKPGGILILDPDGFDDFGVEAFNRLDDELVGFGVQQQQRRMFGLDALRRSVQDDAK